jgi:hypothetical protein
MTIAMAARFSGAGFFGSQPDFCSFAPFIEEQKQWIR